MKMNAQMLHYYSSRSCCVENFIARLFSRLNSYPTKSYALGRAELLHVSAQEALLEGANAAGNISGANRGAGEGSKKGVGKGARRFHEMQVCGLRVAGLGFGV